MLSGGSSVMTRTFAPIDLELRRISMPLVSAFTTSFGSEDHRDILLLRVTLEHHGQLHVGWGECVAPTEPTYSAEYVAAAEMVIAQHMWPRLLGALRLTAADVHRVLAPIKGHQMAKAAIEMAILDAELRAEQVALATHLHGGHPPHRDRIPAGVSVGIFPTIDALLAAVQGYVDEGYQRIKLKIQPGWDLEPVREVRALIGPTLGLQVDANTAYTRADFEHLRRLDEADLLLIEQPLPEDDLLGHRDLATAIATPVCLDESIISLASARDAIEIGAAEIINIKPGRVGGYLEARRIHDLCRDLEIPAWCGGMLETGIGRSANAALASLPGFTLPGDISAAERFYARDIVMQPVTLVEGHVMVPTSTGLGSEVDHEILNSVTRSTRLLGNESL
jgi:o-succinylbenzoate synthase